MIILLIFDNTKKIYLPFERFHTNPRDMMKIPKKIGLNEIKKKLKIETSF